MVILIFDIFPHDTRLLPFQLCAEFLNTHSTTKMNFIMSVASWEMESAGAVRLCNHYVDVDVDAKGYNTTKVTACVT